MKHGKLSKLEKIHQVMTKQCDNKKKNFMARGGFKVLSFTLIIIIIVIINFCLTLVLVMKLIKNKKKTKKRKTG